MKIFNLKRVNWIMALAVMLVVSFTSCSSDSDETVTPVFPNLQEMTGIAGKTVEISFEANLDWELSSNKGWCKIKDGEFTQSNLKGKPGKYTYTVELSTADQSYDQDDVAELKLTMGGSSQVIYKITRSKKAHQNLVVKDEAGNIYDANHPLTIKGNSTIGVEYTTIKAEAEAGTKVGITDCPEWLISRLNEESGMYEFTFNQEQMEVSIKNPIAQGVYSLTIETSDAATTHTDEIVRKVTIPLIYNGLHEDAVIIATTNLNTMVRANGDFADSQTQQLESVIMARNDEFVIVEFAQVPVKTGDVTTLQYDFSANGDLDWVTSAKNADKITVSSVSANESNERRTAIVMVFSKAMYDRIKNDLEGNIIEEIKDEATGKITKEIASVYINNIFATLVQAKPRQVLGKINFRAKYYYTDEKDINSLKVHDVNSNMAAGKGGDKGYEVEVIDVSEDATYKTQYPEITNIWKAIIPKPIRKEFKFGSGNHLIFEALETSEEGLIPEKYNTEDLGSIVNLKTINDKGWNQDLYIENGGKEAEADGFEPVVGVGISFMNPDTYNDELVLAVKENGSVAICIVTIAKE